MGTKECTVFPVPLKGIICQMNHDCYGKTIINTYSFMITICRFVINLQQRYANPHKNAPSTPWRLLLAKVRSRNSLNRLKQENRHWDWAVAGAALDAALVAMVFQSHGGTHPSYGH